MADTTKDATKLSTPLKGGVSFREGIPATAAKGVADIAYPLANVAQAATKGALGDVFNDLGDMFVAPTEEEQKPRQVFTPLNFEETDLGQKAKQFQKQHPLVGGASEIGGAILPLIPLSFLIPGATSAELPIAANILNEAAQQAIIGGVIGGSSALDKELIKQHQQQLDQSQKPNPNFTTDIIKEGLGGAATTAGLFGATTLGFGAGAAALGAGKNAIFNKFFPQKVVEAGGLKQAHEVTKTFEGVQTGLEKNITSLEEQHTKFSEHQAQADLEASATKKQLENNKKVLVGFGLTKEDAKVIIELAKTGTKSSLIAHLPADVQKSLWQQVEKMKALLENKKLQKALADEIKKEIETTHAKIRDIKGIAIPAIKAFHPGEDAKLPLSILPNQLKANIPGAIGEHAKRAMKDEAIKAAEMENRKIAASEAKRVASITDTVPKYTGNPIDDLWVKNEVGKRVEAFQKLSTDPKWLQEQGVLLWRQLQTEVPELTKGIDKLVQIGGEWSAIGKMGWNSVTGGLFRAGMPTSPLLALLSHYFPDGVNKEASKALHHLINYDSAAKNRFVNQYLHPLKVLKEKSGALEGTSLNRVFFDILNKVDHDVLKGLLPEYRKDLAKASRDIALRLDNAAPDVLDFTSISKTVDELNTGKIKLNQDFLHYVDKWIDTAEALWQRDVKAGLVTGDMPQKIGAYMKRVWQDPKPLYGDDLLNAIKKGNYSPVSNNINARHLEERHGANGYIQDGWASIESRIIGAARDHKLEPTLKAVSAILNNNELHPYLHDIAKDVAFRITGGTPGLLKREGEKAAQFVDLLTGNVIKQGLNRVSFGLVNTLQSALTASVYGFKTFSGAFTDAATHPIKYTEMIQKLGVDVGGGAEAFIHEMGGRLFAPNKWMPQGLIEGIKNQVAKVPENIRQGASTVFLKGIFLNTTEENNIRMAAWSALKDHYKMPLSKIEKHLATASEEEVDLAAYIAQKAVTDNIYVGNELNKTVAQDYPGLRTIFAFQKFPASITANIILHSIKNPAIVGRFFNLQYILGGPQAAIPGVLTSGLDSIGKENLYQSLDSPVSNIPKKALGVDVGAKITPAQWNVPGQIVDTFNKVRDTILDPTKSFAERAVGLAPIAPILAVDSISEAIKLVRTYVTDFTKSGDALRSPFASQGKQIKTTAMEGVTKISATGTVPEEKDVLLQTLGISGAGNDIKTIAKMRHMLTTEAVRLEGLQEEVDAGRLTGQALNDYEKDVVSFSKSKQDAIRLITNLPNSPTLLNKPEYQGFNSEELTRATVNEWVRGNLKHFHGTEANSLLNRHLYLEDKVAKDPSVANFQAVQDFEDLVDREYTGQNKPFESPGDFLIRSMEKKMEQSGEGLIINDQVKSATGEL